MKADIVNPGAPSAQWYGRWFEFVAIYRMIQNTFAPGSSNVNFGHESYPPSVTANVVRLFKWLEKKA